MPVDEARTTKSPLEPASARPRLLVITLGGTIAGTAGTGQGEDRSLTGEELLSWIPAARGLFDVVVADIRGGLSFATTPQDLCALAGQVRDRASDVDGVVITSGTDTMEETIYSLALQLDLAIPVVATCAMRQARQPGADGPANLLDALLVAAVPAAAQLGPVLVASDHIHLARFVTKSHTTAVDAFSSPGLGPVGSICEGHVHLSALPVGSDYVGSPSRLEERVELVWTACGSDGLLLEAAVQEARGIVVAGMGGGHVPPQMVPALEHALVEGLPVVLASRCAAGVLLQSTYTGVGSEQHLLSMGLLPAGQLTPLKARLRLMVALASAVDPTEVFPA